MRQSCCWTANLDTRKALLLPKRSHRWLYEFGFTQQLTNVEGLFWSLSRFLLVGICVSPSNCNILQVVHSQWRTNRAKSYSVTHAAPRLGRRQGVKTEIYPCPSGLLAMSNRTRCGSAFRRDRTTSWQALLFCAVFLKISAEC